MPASHESPEETSPSAAFPSPLPVHAYSTPVRLVVVTLKAVAALNLLYIGAHLLHDIVDGAQTTPPLLVALGLVVFSGVPWVAAAILLRLVRGTLELQPELLVLTLRWARFEIPLASIAAIRPFWLPLPGPGLTLRMTSGQGFRLHLQLAEPGAFLSALGAALPSPASTESALRHPSIVYARTRHLFARRRWYFWLIKFGVFPLALTVVLFRLNQYIVYGGPLGEYHLLGLSAYLKSFAIFWAGTAGELVVYAGVLRIAAEALALASTSALPSRARLIRRCAEVVCQLAYFGAVPAYVLSRLLL